MTAFLVLPDGKRVPVAGELVIGRVAGCGVVVVDAKVSRRHARLIAQGGVVEVEDLGSSNGTRVNGRPLRKRRMLRDADVVTVGLTDLRFESGAKTPAEARGDGFAPGEDLFEDEEEREVAQPPRPADPGQDTTGVSPTSSASSSEPSVPEVEVRRGTDAPGELVSESEDHADEEVLVFADDEVVTVRKTPSVAPGNRAGVLQFNKVESRDSLASQDIRQMSGGLRLLMFLIVVAVAVGLFYLGMELVS